MKFSSFAILALMAKHISASEGLRGLQRPPPPPLTRSLSEKMGCMSMGTKGKKNKRGRELFQRISSFPICSQLDASCNVDDETVAEIVAASEDGMTLVYTDSEKEVLGFVDITDPYSPSPLGTVDLDGEPTSVGVLGDYALVAVNTSPDFDNPSGKLVVINIDTQTIELDFDLGGQPDSVAVSPDKQYVAIAIENERDEDEDDGGLPQPPGGFLAVIDTSSSNPNDWILSTVDLTGLSGMFEPSDPEPEFVSISKQNKAVVTLQENNHIAIVDLESGMVEKSFSAGSVDLENVDILEEGIINQTDELTNVPREPDGVTWIGENYFATADEGDLDGGSRGFTIFSKQGQIVFTSGSDLDLLAARLGHYPERRSENKGNEPENVVFAEFGTGSKKAKNSQRLLFVISERSSLVFVYKVNNVYRPELLQILPAGFGPEGGLALPDRDLFIVASENDERDESIRSTLTIYEYGADENLYPTISSVDRDEDTGVPIPWGALSGLAADATDCAVLYAVHDDFYEESRIFVINIDTFPAQITEEIFIKDTDDVLASIATFGMGDNEFSSDDLAARINEDKTVNLDLEGIAVSSDGGFWLVSEGAGTIDDRPIESPNLLLKVDEGGKILEVITLPDEVNAIQRRFGFVGVAEAQGDVLGGKVVVAFEREWNDESGARIGLYDPDAESWTFFLYELDAPESQNGGSVSLADIAPLENGKFIVLERDNQGGPDAAIKRLYRIDLENICLSGTDPETGFQIVQKTFEHDLIPHLEEPGGLVVEKVDGLARTVSGDMWIVNNNDGADDNSGETQLIQVS